MKASLIIKICDWFLKICWKEHSPKILKAYKHPRNALIFARIVSSIGISNSLNFSVSNAISINKKACQLTHQITIISTLAKNYKILLRSLIKPMLLIYIDKKCKRKGSNIKFACIFNYSQKSTKINNHKIASLILFLSFIKTTFSKKFDLISI